MIGSGAANPNKPEWIKLTQFNKKDSIVMLVHASPATQCIDWRNHRCGETCATCQVRWPGSRTRKLGENKW